MVLHCKVHLDNPKNIYEPGDKITGHVELELEVRLLIKAVAIKYTGYAEVQWKTLLPMKKNSKTKKSKQLNGEPEPVCQTEVLPETHLEVYNNREEFLSNTNYFIGSEEASVRIMERGSYTYPFIVSLPQSCPSSFESVNGHIRYMIEVFVEHKNKKEIWYSQQLCVLKPCELCQCAHVMNHSGNVSVEEKIRLRLFKHPLKMYVSLEQVGFVPGEPISINVQIQNPDKLHLHEVTYELLQICRITASHGYKKSKTRYFHTTLAKAAHNLYSTRDVDVQHLQVLFMPQAIVPNTDPLDCRCLQVSYELNVRLSTDKKKRSLQATIPITVGTVSLNSVQGMANVHQMETKCSNENTVKSNATLSTADGASNYASATAPETPTQNMTPIPLVVSSYREAQHMPKIKFDADQKKSKYKREQTYYKPTYLYYDMEHIPTVQSITTSGTTSAAVAQTSDATNEVGNGVQTPESRPYAGVIQ